MKIFIKKTHSQEFLVEKDRWTPLESEAKDFQSSLNALFYCQTNRIKDVEIVMHFQKAENDVHLPIRGSYS